MRARRAALAMLALGWAWGGALALAAGQADTLLDHYLADLHSLRTQFTQTVSDAHGKLVESGAGSLLVQRPGRFRWEYTPQRAGNAGNADADQGQLLVADGRNLWFYDRELAQVTVKPLAAALSATPIMLLSGSAADLRASFEVRADGQHDGLSWVLVRPRSEQADFSEARLGFHGDELARMIFHDKLGQAVQLDFSHSERNGALDPMAFQFKVPAGVDVIGTPQS